MALLKNLLGSADGPVAFALHYANGKMHLMHLTKMELLQQNGITEWNVQF